jgi:hypothetical protein
MVGQSRRSGATSLFFQEAISHLGNAIAMADKGRSAPTATSNPRLKLQTYYAQAVAWLHGWGDRDAAAAFMQARSLSPVGDASRSYFAAQHGHCIGSLLRGDVRSALEASEAFLCEVERERRPTEIGVALRALGLTHCAMGSLKPAALYLERALAEYDPERDREVRFSFGQDTKAAAAACLSYIY